MYGLQEIMDMALSLSGADGVEKENTNLVAYEKKRCVLRHCRDLKANRENLK